LLPYPDILVLSAATIAALASIVSIFVNVYLTTTVERRNRLWNKEFERFLDLEERVGILVEDLLRFSIRTEIEKDKFFGSMQLLRDDAGRFRRYPEIMQALRDLNHYASWYFSQDMKHDTKEEFNEAKNDLLNSYKILINAIDKIVKR
jgi:hypothetical protein